MIDIKTYTNIEELVNDVKDGIFHLTEPTKLYPIFEDEKGKILLQKYRETFKKDPSWYFEEETPDECYKRLEKEIKNHKTYK